MPLDPPPAPDAVLAGAFGVVALVAVIHLIRRFSTQDPPPHAETRLVGWLLVAAHLTVLVLDVAGAIDPALAGAREVPLAHHAGGVLLGATMTLLAAWLRDR